MNTENILVKLQYSTRWWFWVGSACFTKPKQTQSTNKPKLLNDFVCLAFKEQCKKLSKIRIPWYFYNFLKNPNSFCIAPIHLRTSAGKIRHFRGTFMEFINFVDIFWIPVLTLVKTFLRILKKFCLYWSEFLEKFLELLKIVVKFYLEFLQVLGHWFDNWRFFWSTNFLWFF